MPWSRTDQEPERVVSQRQFRTLKSEKGSGPVYQCSWESQQDGKVVKQSLNTPSWRLARRALIGRGPWVHRHLASAEQWSGRSLPKHHTADREIELGQQRHGDRSSHR